MGRRPDFLRRPQTSVGLVTRPDASKASSTLPNRPGATPRPAPATPRGHAPDRTRSRVPPTVACPADRCTCSCAATLRVGSPALRLDRPGTRPRSERASGTLEPSFPSGRPLLCTTCLLGRARPGWDGCPPQPRHSVDLTTCTRRVQMPPGAETDVHVRAEEDQEPRALQPARARCAPVRRALAP